MLDKFINRVYNEAVIKRGAKQAAGLQKPKKGVVTMSKAMKIVSKMIPAAHEENKAAHKLSEGLCRFANESVDTDRTYLNVNGYVMSVRLPY